MHEKLSINNPQASASDASGSFEQELRDLARKRTRLMLTVATGVVLAIVVVDYLIGEPRAGLQGGLTPLTMQVRLAHIISFAMATLLTYALERGSTHQFQLLAFWVLAFNLVLAIFLNASLTPDEAPYFAASIGLFIFAVFIPSPPRYPVWLGLLSLMSFIIATAGTYVFVPEASSYWAALGGVSALTDHLVRGISGIAALAVVAHIASRTLYSLRRTAHAAQRLGNYVLEQELGSGGMGQVFRARHALIRRPTALKVMKASSDAAETSIARFEREVQLSAGLTHPNTITIFDYGRTADAKFYYAMEYLEGLDLHKIVQLYGPLPAERSVYVLRQVCGALGEAHERGIIHRDIKPQNIFITQRGGLYDFVKVLDFGLAKQLVGDGADLTQTGMTVGTPRYISPELVKGSAGIDGRSDLYSLGAVAYWMLSGRPPFDAESSMDVLMDHLQAVPSPLSQVSELAIPGALEAAVMRCLEKRPEDRFRSVHEFGDALRDVSFADPWSQEKAQQWWNVHRPENDPDTAGQPDDAESGFTNRGVSRFFFEP